MDFDVLMRQLEALLRGVYKKHEDIRFATGNRRLTMFVRERESYLAITWKLDTYTDSLSRPTNWPEDL